MSEQPAPARARELASLYATAKSLTALAELDEVLDSIVRHAHELFGTDFTYLSLVGADGELRVTASEGTISADFRAARMPAGTGLGGRVVATGSAHWVSDYAVARDVEHDAVFDSLVGGEGMVALLGVPLLVRGETLGVLFASDRRRREFHADEVALLAAFADHAAVALDNARLYDESRSALARLREAYTTIEEHVAGMERAPAVHEALTELVLEGGGAEDVAGRLATRLGGRVTILDPDRRPVARGESPGSAGGPVDPADGAVTAAVAEAGRTGRCATVPDGSGGHHCAVAIRAGDTDLGSLVWSSAGAVEPVDVRTVERASHIMGLLALRESAAADAAERLSGELLTELLVHGWSAVTSQHARARSRGVDVDRLDLAVVVVAEDASPADLARRLRSVGTERAGLVGEHLGRATMLVPGEDPAELVEQLHRRLRRELGRPVTVVADPVQQREWSAAVARASRCATVAEALDAGDGGFLTSRFALYAVLFDPERSAELAAFVDGAVGPLVAYDRERGTDLVATLGRLFECGGNLRRTAEAMHVHLNTLLKRLDRTTAVLGYDWRAGDDLDLRLAVRLHLLRARHRL